MTTIATGELGVVSTAIIVSEVNPCWWIKSAKWRRRRGKRYIRAAKRYNELQQAENERRCWEEMGGL